MIRDLDGYIARRAAELRRRLDARDRWIAAQAGLIKEYRRMMAPDAGGDDVHVDWHMTPGEWSDLRAVLNGTQQPSDSARPRRLREDGALDA